MLRVGVTGYKGHVGKTLVDRHGVIPLDCDVTNLAEVEERIDNILPDIIIHTASKTSPDWCEKKENQEKAIAVNVRGTYHVCDVADQRGIPVVVLSTDHIFDGKHGPYKEDARGKWLQPVNFYGKTKLAMETISLSFEHVKVVRTSNLFWKKDPRVLWYVDSLESVDVPTFQTRSFMHLYHFADSLIRFIEKFDQMPRILNISGSETVDWLTFVKAFAEAVGRPTDIFYPKTMDEKHYVARPQKGGLDTSLFAKLGIRQYSYLDGLEEMKNE